MEPQEYFNEGTPFQSMKTYTWAVTGTFHGSLIEAETEGEARRIFHDYYNGESITHVKKKDHPALAY